MHCSTAVIQIGNTDNKLTQEEWAQFAQEMHFEIVLHTGRVHFSGGSDWNAPWQNACWVCDISQDKLDGLKDAVAQVRKQYNQDAAALTLGFTQMV